MSLCSGTKSGTMSAVIPASPTLSQQRLKGEVDLDYTESALRELYQQVNNMPDSAKKKKLIRQVPSVPAMNTESAKIHAANVALWFLHSLKSSHCTWVLLTLGHLSAGNTGVHALWGELLR